jgi:excisionase family DNA binding protein
MQSCMPERMELLTVAEVAALLRVSDSWLYLAAQEGRIPAVRLGGEGGPVRFERAALRAYLAACRTGPPPRPRVRGEHGSRR